ncbi:Cullin repeat-like-containing domain protein [Gymnopilus junonius]|uniref:Cullin repeat-like-containing domain protein n=1 Tax=Gymnopilus junonius TaxID=109634 RepID=A0A9P5TI13_GYMJU|nr:Cullin repeat-like-containing domain protein [Gymnopilus junonius]
MDDETAEIELLQQNLSKTRHISKKMTTILDSFDTRLAKLEKSILPLYTAAQLLNKRRHNIDLTLARIEDLSGTQQDLAADESLILRGPQPGQISLYREALERLNTSIVFNSSDIDLVATARLVEAGAKKLTQLYTTLAAEGSSGLTPAPGSTMLTSFPASLLPTLSPIVSFLRTLPIPSTHPSHPAAPVILATLREAQTGYADMRGNWSVKCLEGQGKRLVARAETVDPLLTGREFTEWEEYKLLLELSPLPAPLVLASSYAALLAPILKLFNTVLTQLIALIRKSLHKYNFLALSAYQGLLSLQGHWEQVLSRRGPDVGEKNELKDGLQSLRAICLRSFPEFLADVKLGAMAKGGSDTSVKVVDFVLSTVAYIERIPQVQSAVESALYALGDGNWKMGEGVQVGTNKNKEEDDGNIVEHFMTSSQHASTPSKTSRTARRTPFNSTFLLNNIPTSAHTSSPPPPPPPARTSSPPDHRTPHILLPHRQSRDKGGAFGVGGGGAKAQAKEKFTRFFDVLEEVVERHRFARVLEEEEERRGRGEMGDEIVMLVVPSFARFVQKQKDKEFSKNVPEDVESQLRSLFR